MNEWNIQSRAHACQACGKTFSDQEEYHTLLIDAKQCYQRMDVCTHCWSSQYGEGASDRKGFISCWHGIYQLPPAAPPDPIQKETAESLLRKLLELNDPKHAAAVYILAVMLERKRLLKVKEQLFRDGQRTFIYEHPKTGDIFTVLDPNLQLDQLESVQRDVGLLLEGGIQPPPDATRPTDQPGETAVEVTGTEVPEAPVPAEDEAAVR